MYPLNITQPLGIWSIMATIRWCPIFPKWDIYQPLKKWVKKESRFFFPPEVPDLAEDEVLVPSCLLLPSVGDCASAPPGLVKPTWQWEMTPFFSKISPDPRMGQFIIVRLESKLLLKWGGFVWKCWVYIPNEIAIFNRDNDQQYHWV